MRILNTLLHETTAMLGPRADVEAVDVPSSVLIRIVGVLCVACVAVLMGIIALAKRADKPLLDQSTRGREPSPERDTPPSDAQYSFGRLLLITSPTFAYSFLATTLTFIMLPDESRGFFTEPSWTLGWLYIVSAFAELPGPLCGAISDGLNTPYGRRRPLIVLAVVMVSATMCCQWLAAQYHSLPCFSLALFCQMVSWGLLYTAQQGLILDVVDSSQLNLASSCQAVFVACGACLAFLSTATNPAEEPPCQPRRPIENRWEWLKNNYYLDFDKHYDYSLAMVCKGLMYGGGVAKGYLVYFLRDTWNVTDLKKLHVKVAQIAIAAEACAATTAILVMCFKHDFSPNDMAITGACIIAVSWTVMIPLGFFTEGFDYTELFAFVYGIGHGLMLVGDQALTLHLVPDKAAAARFLGMQNVTAFLGIGIFGVLCAALVDSFGRVHQYHLPGPRAGEIPSDGYRLEGYIALFVFVASTSFLWASLLKKIRRVK